MWLWDNHCLSPSLKISPDCGSRSERGKAWPLLGEDWLTTVWSDLRRGLELLGYTHINALPPWLSFRITRSSTNPSPRPQSRPSNQSESLGVGLRLQDFSKLPGGFTAWPVERHWLKKVCSLRAASSWCLRVKVLTWSFARGWGEEGQETGDWSDFLVPGALPWGCV